MFNSTSTPKILETAIRAGESYLWNGPVCTYCGRGYIGSSFAHKCAEADLLAVIAVLQKRLDDTRAAT